METKMATPVADLAIEVEAGQLVLRGSCGYIRLGALEQDKLLKYCESMYWKEFVLNDSLEEKEDFIPENYTKYPHYFKTLPKGTRYLDIYFILDLWNVTSQSLGHAIKKLLAPGLRHGKDYLQDITEARNTLNREIEIETFKRRSITDE